MIRVNDVIVLSLFFSQIMDDKNKAQPPPYPTQPGMAPYPAQPNAGMPPYPPQPGPAVYGAPAPYPPQSNQGFNFGQPVSHT